MLARRLDIPAAREGWHEEQVDLSSYAGRTVTLTLNVIPVGGTDVWGQ